MAFDTVKQGLKRILFTCILTVIVFAGTIFAAVFLAETTSKPGFLFLALIPVLWVQFYPAWRRKATDAQPHPRPNWPLAAALWTVIFVLSYWVMGIELTGSLLVLCVLMLVIIAMMFFIHLWAGHMSDKREQFPFDWLD